MKKLLALLVCIITAQSIYSQKVFDTDVASIEVFSKETDWRKLKAEMIGRAELPSGEVVIIKFFKKFQKIEVLTANGDVKMDTTLEFETKKYMDIKNREFKYYVTKDNRIFVHSKVSKSDIGLNLLVYDFSENSKELFKIVTIPIENKNFGVIGEAYYYKYGSTYLKLAINRTTDYFGILKRTTTYIDSTQVLPFEVLFYDLEFNKISTAKFKIRGLIREELYFKDHYVIVSQRNYKKYYTNHTVEIVYHISSINVRTGKVVQKAFQINQSSGKNFKCKETNNNTVLLAGFTPTPLGAVESHFKLEFDLNTLEHGNMSIYPISQEFLLKNANPISIDLYNISREKNRWSNVFTYEVKDILQREEGGYYIFGWVLNKTSTSDGGIKYVSDDLIIVSVDESGTEVYKLKIPFRQVSSYFSDMEIEPYAVEYNNHLYVFYKDNIANADLSVENFKEDNEKETALFIQKIDANGNIVARSVIDLSNREYKFYLHKIRYKGDGEIVGNNYGSNNFSYANYRFVKIKMK